MVRKRRKNYNCKVCGRETGHADGLCSKHFDQISLYGYPLEDSPRRETDPNLIIEEGDIAKIELYDLLFEPLETYVLIDIEDVDKVEKYSWKKKNGCIIGNNKMLLPNLILDTDEKVEYVNGDFWDCRKENLKIVEKEWKKPMRKKNKDNKIIIETIGGSTVDVTGSCWAIHYPKRDGEMGCFIIEAGMVQGGTVLEDYNANKRMINAIPFNYAEFILIGHPHVDHIGNICACIPNGFKGEIYSSRQTLAVSEKLLLDCSFIHDRNIKDLNKGKKNYEKLYDDADVYLAIDRFHDIPTNEMVRINEYVSIKLLNNSHCFGANQIEIYIRKPSSHVVKILYTSDLGSKHNVDFQPFVYENELCNKADVMIIESTYGDRKSFTKQQCVEERKDLLKNIKEVINNRHRCLIPCFSFQRSQMAMCMLYEEFKDKDLGDTTIVVDSRLTNEINNTFLNILEGEQKEYFKEVLSWSRFKFITSFKDTEKLIVKKDQPMIIISSSGMIDNGHAKTWASSLLTNKNDAIFFIGYCGKNTLGNKIQNPDTKTVTIDGVVCPKRCKIVIYKTFSSHAQQSDLLEYIKHINIGKSILLHHGSEDAKTQLKILADEENRRIGKTTKITIVGKGCDTFTI